MLRRVQKGRLRLVTPGVALDERGVLLGKELAGLFGSLDGVVSWLRIVTANMDLAEIARSLKVERVRNPVGATSFVVRFAIRSSYEADVHRGYIEMAGGLMFTGSQKHYVQYRDREAPFGYDLGDVPVLDENISLALHTEKQMLPVTAVGTVQVLDLLLRLSLRAEPRERYYWGSVWVWIPEGIRSSVLRYLWRNHVAGHLALVRPVDGQAHRGGLFRLKDCPERVVSLFRSLPKVRVFKPVSETVGVEVGYRHVFHLDNCSQLFSESEELFLFHRDGVSRLEGQGTEVAFDALVELDDGTEPEMEALVASAPENAAVSFRLRDTSATQKIAGILLEPGDVGRLKQLVYLLPGSLLSQYQVFSSETYWLILGSGDTGMIPLGRPLVEVSRGVYICSGKEIMPAIGGAVFAKLVGHRSDFATVVLSENNLLQFRRGTEHSLVRHVVAGVPPLEVPATSYAVSAGTTPEISNEDPGAFPLWGVSRLPEKT